MTRKQYQTYVVNQGDTLEGIAYNKLGSTERWRDVAALNHMRFPFISDQPSEWFGPILTTGILPTYVGAGAIEVKLSGERRDVIVPQSFLFVDGYKPNGDSATIYQWEAVEVVSYDPNAGVIFLLTPTKYTWRIGSRFRVFPPTSDLGTIVAKPGDRILLPLEIIDDGTIGTSGKELYGSDIALAGIYGYRRKGRPYLVDGDLAIVSGVDNMGQSLWMRTMLPYGSYLFHPEEGNRMWDMLGETVRSETAYIAASYLRDALFTDPRVAQITDLNVSIPQADTIAVEATVRLEGSEQTISLNEIVRSQFGG